MKKPVRRRKKTTRRKATTEGRRPMGYFALHVQKNWRLVGISEWNPCPQTPDEYDGDFKRR